MNRTCLCFSSALALRNSSIKVFRRKCREYSCETSTPFEWLVDKKTCGIIANVTSVAARSFRSSPPHRPRTDSSPFRPKQSLAQNFLKDKGMISKIVRSFDESFQQLSPEGKVIEIGAGIGALSGPLLESHPTMLAVEIDQRAVDFLRQKFPNLEVLNDDVLNLNWTELKVQRGGPLAVVGNLPYNIVSQILFSMLEAQAGTIRFAMVMMQKEVANRICAKPHSKDYGILSVVSQLYSKPKRLFDVPNTVFYPKPDVTSSMLRFEFIPDSCLDVRNRALTAALRTVVRASFQQRRKTLRNSLRNICLQQKQEVCEEWAGKRPEELTPPEFVELTQQLFAATIANANASSSISKDDIDPVWRPRRPSR